MRSLLLLLLCVLLVLGADKGVRGDAFAKDNKNSDATIAVSVSSDGHAEARLSGAGDDDTGKEPKRQAASPWPPLSDNLKFYNDLIPSRPQGCNLFEFVCGIVCVCVSLSPPLGVLCVLDVQLQHNTHQADFELTLCYRCQAVHDSRNLEREVGVAREASWLYTMVRLPRAIPCGAG